MRTALAFLTALVLLVGVGQAQADSPAHAVASGAAPQSESASVEAWGPAPADFSRTEAGWLTFEYHPSLAASARRLVDVGSDLRERAQALLGKPVLRQVTVRMGRTPGEMETLAPRGAKLPRYASGVAFAPLGLVLLTDAPRYSGERHDLAEVFRHELLHVALHDAVGQERVPRWFNEGFAVHLSGEAETARIQALWTATLAGTLIPLSEIDRRFPADASEAGIAYAQSADLVRYLLRTGEEHRFRDLLARLESGQPFEQAVADAYGSTLFLLERDWKRDLARRYTFWPVLFGGSLVWGLGIGLLVIGYVKRRRRAKQKLLDWAREEAQEDARRELALAVLRQSGPVRVVVAPAGVRPLGASSAEAPASAASIGGRPLLVAPPGGGLVPKIEHEGSWHTLH